MRAGTFPRMDDRGSLRPVEAIFLRKQALSLWQEGQRFHLEGNLHRAIECYGRSIEVFPTAEAYTFRGWAYSFQNRIEDAIAECKKAIQIDPSFGNPYNDIGSYLMAQGKMGQAVHWLQKAKRAARYEPRHFPYINLGRVFTAQGLVSKAIREFETALRICPEDHTVVAALSALRRRVN
jgi:tetratricopeptide (TPR) repeat protein